jgi:hypothetical protein
MILVNKFNNKFQAEPISDFIDNFIDNSIDDFRLDSDFILMSFKLGFKIMPTLLP